MSTYTPNKNPSFELIIKILFWMVVAFVIISLITACRSKKITTSTTVTETRLSDSTDRDKQTTQILTDSTVLTESIVKMDTSITVDADRASAVAHINKRGKIELLSSRDGRYSKIVFKTIKKGKDKIVYMDCIIDSFEIAFTYYNRNRELFTSKTDDINVIDKTYQKNTDQSSTVSETETVIVKYRWPWWMYVLIIGGGLAVLIYFLWPVIKKYLNPIR